MELPEEDDDDDESVAREGREIKSHRAFRVRSIIDVPAWDQARWSGTLYLQIGPRRTPGIAFIFRNEEAARKIFERWRERFGNSDTNEEIYLAIVRNLPKKNPHHYVMLVTSKRPDLDRHDPKLSVIASRSMTMTPDSATNLQQFLDAYGNSGEFYLLPAVITNGVPEVMQEFALLKRHVSVKDAASVGEHDIEIMALRGRG